MSQSERRIVCVISCAHLLSKCWTVNICISVLVTSTCLHACGVCVCACVCYRVIVYMKINKHVCQTIKSLHLNCLCALLCICVCIICHAYLAKVVAEQGIPIIIIKPTLFSLFEVRQLLFPLATTLQRSQTISSCKHAQAHTLTLTPTHTPTPLCAILQAGTIVRVITRGVVCLVTFSLYELGAIHSPSILSIDSN